MEGFYQVKYLYRIKYLLCENGRAGGEDPVSNTTTNQHQQTSFGSQGKKMKLKPPKPPCNEGRNLLFQGNTIVNLEWYPSAAGSTHRSTFWEAPTPTLCTYTLSSLQGTEEKLFATAQEAKNISFKTLIHSLNTAWKSAHGHCNVWWCWSWMRPWFNASSWREGERVSERPPCLCLHINRRIKAV